MKRVIIPVLILVLFVLNACSASRSSAGVMPEKIAADYAASVTEGNWHRIADLMHSDALAAIGNLMELLPASRKSPDILFKVFGTESREEAAELTVKVLFARFMSYADNISGLSKTMADSKTQIMGSVFEGEDTCHVLFRLETLIKNLPYKTTDVISMAKISEGWGILMKADINL